MIVNRIMLFLFIICFQFSADAKDFKASEGVIDFSSWELNKTPLQTLNGDWEFYWKRHIDPADYILNDTNQREYRNCHQNWNSYKDSNGKNFPAKGFATYRIEVKNLPEGELNIVIRNTLCAAAVYIDYDLVAEIGKVGTKKELMEPSWEDRIIPIPEDKKDFIITVMISNFHHRKGGFNDPFYIGKQEDIYALQRQQMMLNGFETSTCLFAGCFFLTLFIFRRKDKTPLFFALFCLTVAIRPFVSGNYMIYSIFPDFNWNLLIHLEYLSLFLPSAFTLLFIRERFPKQSPKKLLKWFAIFMFVEAALSILLPSTIFSWLVLPHQLLTLISLIVILVVIIKALKARENGALFGGTAIICLLSGAILTIVQYLDLVDPMPFVYTGLQLGFILSMSLILGSKFASQFRKVEYLQTETETQRAQLAQQNIIVEEKNHEITSSISYARRIQTAILPSDTSLKDHKPESFILYKPKDIVAGDFYWVEQVNDLVYVAAADCTGHGVPGAMVSVVCNAALNRCIREFNIKDPGLLLDKAREIVVETFQKSGEDVKDGMDISLCVFNKKTGEFKFAGANNPIWIIHPKNDPEVSSVAVGKVIEKNDFILTEVKGDKQAVGLTFNPKPFVTKELQLTEGQKIYLISDGFPDQFGGPKGKKFMYKPFKNLLLDIHALSFAEQEQKLNDAFESWRGEIEQTDDVCIIGFEI